MRSERAVWLIVMCPDIACSFANVPPNQKPLCFQNVKSKRRCTTCHSAHNRQCFWRYAGHAAFAPVLIVKTVFPCV
ncbi:hypothetical protein Dda3937_04639 [Dickeya dadantii 3937]|uniref:Uncharacterized protein n=1 Tax=Dickeya dadantii (strain 3937) TaxID=198628 RepID=E0SIP7_DICD3|nr:hypothetical protein Dda3937_04639 [Dickeya dadantii 3937]